MEFSKVIKERKSTRLFSKNQVEQEKLDIILEAGRIAPTAKNMQPYKVYVVQSAEGLDKIDKATKCRYSSPCVLMICDNKDTTYVKNDKPMCDMDCSIVATHMMLAATDNGVDNIWIELFKPDVLINEFNLPDNLVPVILMPIGYKATLCPPSPMHKIRKPLKDLVEYL